MSRVFVCIFTTSRYEYLERMLASFEESVNTEGVDEVYRIMMDDYPLRRDEARLKALCAQYHIDELILNPTNFGYSLAWRTMWDSLPARKKGVTDYIWQQEEDFIFTQPIHMKDLIDMFCTCPIPLAQLCLRRQVWYQENDFIRDIEENRLGTEVSWGNDRTIISQTRYFLPHPGIYPRWVCDIEYDHNPQEGVIRYALSKIQPDIGFGVLGARQSVPHITHIGDYNQGKRCCPGEPGWENWKVIDPNKQYNSKGYMVEWNK